MTEKSEICSDRGVLAMIACGLIVIIVGIVVGIFTTPRTLPNWAENVLVSIASVAGLKLGDCIGVLVQLSTGRQVERLGNQLAGTVPAGTGDQPPVVAGDAAGTASGGDNRPTRQPAGPTDQARAP